MRIAIWLTAFLCLPQVASAHSGKLAIAVPLEGITIDGDLSDWPEGMREYPIALPEYGEPPKSKEDFQAFFRVGYSAEKNQLYVAVEVQDDSAVLDSTVAADWDTQDGSGLFVGLPDEEAIDVLGISGYERKYNTLKMPSTLSTMTTPGGRSYEYLVDGGDLSDQGFRFGPNMALSFDTVVGDMDEDGSYSWVAWGPGTRKRVHERMGDIVLSEGGATGTIRGGVIWEDKEAGTRRGVVKIRSRPSEVVWAQAKLDSQGAYEVDLPPGEYSVAAGYGRGDSKSIEVSLEEGR